jgi:hypothetical protein
MVTIRMMGSGADQQLNVGKYSWHSHRLIFGRYEGFSMPGEKSAHGFD